MARAKKTKTKTVKKPVAAAKPKTKPTAERKLSDEDLAGELRQLAAIRRLFPVLDTATAAALLATHDADACRDKGTATRSADTFRIAMVWARTFGENVDDPAVDNASIRVRWFLDCLNALGSAIAGNAVSDDPIAEGTFHDAAVSAQQLLTRSTRRARAAAGTQAPKLAAIDRALAPSGAGDPLIGRLRRLSRLIDDWRTSTAPGTPPLAAYGVTAQTVYRLRDAAQALEDAVANRPAPRQVDRDTPMVNTAEGRVFFVMRSLWDDMAEAREDGTTTLQLAVSPALLRGLGMNARNRAEPNAPTPTPS